MQRYSTSMAQIQEQMLVNEYMDSVLALDEDQFIEYYDSLSEEQQEELNEFIGKIAKGIGKIAVAPITLPYKVGKAALKGVGKAVTSNPAKKAAGLVGKGAAALAKGAGKAAKATVVNKQGNVRFSTAGRADAAKKKADAIAKRNDERERLAKEKERIAKERERAQKLKGDQGTDARADVTKQQRALDKEKEKVKDTQKKEIDKEKNEATDYLKTAYSYKTGEKNESVEEKFKPTAGELYVITAGPGDNAQKVIGTNKDLKKAQKMRDDYNKKNKPSKPSHKARIYAQTRASQSANKFKIGDKIMYSTYGNKAQFTKVKENFFKEEVEDLEEFTSKQIARLKKEYEPLRGKSSGIAPEKFAKLRKMMDRFQKPNLLALAKADIPILSSAAKAKLVIKFGMKWQQLPEDLIPYIDVFADDTLDEQKGKFASVDPKVIDRIEKMMRGSRAEKDSIANMLNYLMPPEVVDMVRYKLKIVPKRGKIKF